MSLLPFGAPPAPVKKLTAGTAISLTPSSGLGSVSVANIGVTSLVAGTGISVSGPTGAVTISNTGAVSPLTTKGDIWGFDSANNRIPVGSDGFPLIADSGQALGVGYATRAFNFNAQNLENLAVITNATTPKNPASTTTGYIEDALAQSISGTTAALNIAGTKTLTANSLNYYTLQTNPAVALGSTTGGTYATWEAVPSFSGTGNLSNYYGWQLSGTLPAVTNIAVGFSVSLAAGVSKTVNEYQGIQIGGGAGFGTSTLTVGIDVGVVNALTGTAIWAVQAGNYQSYWNGKTTWGNTTAPTYAMHLRGGGGATVNSATNAFGLDLSTTGPSQPAAGNMALSCYKGATSGHTFILITSNISGTTNYISLDLTGGGVTWVHGTALPT